MEILREAAPLRTKVVAALRTKIVSGEYPPHMRLVEKRLETQFGVSRTVIREALRQLETESLVAVEPNVGPIVRALTLDEVEHLYGVRAALESAAGRYAAELSAPTRIDALRAAFDDIERDAETADAQALIGLKNAFYAALIAASGNPIIGEMLGNVQARISQLRAVTLRHPGRSARMIEELRAVVEAIEAGRPDEAERACREHVAAAQRIALDSLGHMPKSPDTFTTAAR